MKYKVSLWMLLSALFLSPMFTSCEELNDNEEDDIYVTIIGGDGGNDGGENDHDKDQPAVSILGTWMMEIQFIEYEGYKSITYTFNEDNTGVCVVKEIDDKEEVWTYNFLYSYNQELEVLTVQTHRLKCDIWAFITANKEGAVLHIPDPVPSLYSGVFKLVQN